MNRDQQLGRKLLEQGLLPPQIVQQALNTPKRSDQDLCDVLVERSYINSGTAEWVRGATGLVRPSASALQNSHSAVRPQASRFDAQTLNQRQQIAAAWAQSFQADPLFSPHAEVAFERLEKLGEGGMGVVYRIRDKRLKREAALKLLLKTPNQDRRVQRFLRELHITARLDHPAIPPVYEAGTTPEGEHFMVMRVIEGRTLSERIEDYHTGSRSPRVLRELLQILVRASEAMSYAHNRDLIHRDLKPENIMVGAHGEVMVMDWGLARDLTGDADDDALIESGGQPQEGSGGSAGLTMEGGVLGTPGYMAPEQARSEEADQRSDVFALGGILSEILTGSPPVDGESSLIRVTAVADGRIVRPIQRDRGVPKELNSIAAKALAFQPKERFQTVDDWIEPLRCYLNGEWVRCHSYGLGERLTRMVRRYPGRLMAASGLLIFLAIGGFLWASLESAKHQKDLATQRNLLTETRLKEEQNARNLAEQESKRREALVKRAQDAERVATEGAQRANLCIEHFSKAQDKVRRGMTAKEVAVSVNLALANSTRSLSHYLLAAKIFEDGQHYDQARHCLERAIEDHPPGLEALLQLHHLRMSELGTDKFTFTRPLKRLVKIARSQGLENQYTWFVDAAMYQIRDRNYSKAIEFYTKSLKLNPRSISALVNRGVCYIEKLQWQNALKDLNLASEISNRDASVFLNRGIVYDALKRPQRALDDFTKAIRLNPNNANAYVNRSLTRLSIKNYAKALYDVERAIELETRNPKVYYLRGRCYFGLKQYENAQRDFLKALELEPKDFQSLHYLSRARLNLEDFEGLLETCNELIKAKPNQARYYFNRASAYMSMNKPEKAIEDLNTVLKYKARDPYTLNNRANILLSQGDFEGSLRDLNSCLEINPQNYTARKNRGGVLHRLGRYQEGLKDFDIAVKTQAQDWEAHYGRALCLGGMKEMNQAKAAFAETVRLNPKHVQALWNLGVCHYKGEVRDEKAAEDCWSRCLALDPNRPDILLVRAELRAEQSRHVEALADLGRYFELAPGDADEQKHAKELQAQIVKALTKTKAD